MAKTARVITRLLGASLLSALLACSHASRVRTAPAGADVTVTFADPRTLTLTGRQGDTASAARVKALSGRVLESTDLAMEIRVTSLTDSEGRRIGQVAGSGARVPVDSTVRIERSGVSITRASLAALGACLGLFALGIALGGGGL